MSRRGKTAAGGRKTSRHPIRDLAVVRWPLWVSEAAVLWLFWFVSRCLPVERAAVMGQEILRHLGPRFRRHRHICTNLSVALPQRDAEEIDRLARGVWANFGRVLAEFAHLPELCGPRAANRVELVKLSDLEVFDGSGRPAVFIGAHTANWEVGAARVAAHGVPLTAIYTPESNPLVAAMVQRRRTATGCGYISKLEGLRPLMRELDQGRSIGLLTDRRIEPGDMLPFFGLDMSITFSPARLALRYGCQLVPVQVERVGRSRFRVTLHPPVEPDDENASDQEKATQMMRKVHALFETWIAQRPDEWFCSKRMWPKSTLAHRAAAPERS